MKKILYLLLLVFPLMAFAQETEDRPPLLKEGRIWKYYCYSYANQYYFSHYVHGDTVIEDNVWKKVYSGVYLQGTYTKAMREEGGKVYVYDEYGPSLFLDYDAPVGERPCQRVGWMYADTTAYAEVVGRDTLHNNGYVYDTVVLNQYGNPTGDDTSQWEKIGTSRWIVGIGGDAGIYESVRWRDEIGYSSVLISVRDGDTCLYSAEEPVIFLGVTPIEMPSPSGRCFDLQGRSCNSKFIIQNCKKGVYIRDGRKYVR